MLIIVQHVSNMFVLIFVPGGVKTSNNPFTIYVCLYCVLLISSLGFCTLFMFSLLLTPNLILAQGRIHHITVDFENVAIREDASFTDAEMEFFGSVGTAEIPVKNGCTIDEFNECRPYRLVYLTPGSGLDDAGEGTYYFTVPDKRIRVDVGDGGSFIIKTHAYNRGPTFVGETIILCNDSITFVENRDLSIGTCHLVQEVTEIIV